MRGTPPLPLLRSHLVGLIPTYAGNTPLTRFLRVLRGAHPHVCGEHALLRSRIGSTMGSSPRMRGTPKRLKWANLAVVAHPHVCGEHPACETALLLSRGSSPRMRGTPAWWRCRRGQGGLIPTYAGNTCQSVKGLNPDGAHPHVCGEHTTGVLSLFIKRGSSPRMRGTQQFLHNTSLQNGLIPTYAGNTRPGRFRWRFWRAHPHVCGEHSGPFPPLLVTRGSSPRMRGTPNILQQGLPLTGLIPTYAGNTGRAGGRSRRRRAHPHVCGEHSTVTVNASCESGSSPRMRGTLKKLKLFEVSVGLIPTYAGNTRGCR